MNNISIPFNKSSLEGRELEHIFHTITIGQIAGDQMYSKKCHLLLEELFGVKKVLLTTSCTHALEMSALLLDIKPGDQVLVPSFTFVSTINAFVMRGAEPIFCDIRPDTLNLDETKIANLITKKTKAIVPVHYAGVGCEMDTINGIAKSFGIHVIEDNAHGLFGKYKGHWLGTMGTFGTQSFHETKNVTCGEGGALLINDDQFIDRAEIIREKGTNRSRFFRGQIDKYSWIDLGSSYVMSDVLAAFLYAQLEEGENIQSKRKRIWQKYYSELKDWGEENNVKLPYVPLYCEQAWHMFYLILPSSDKRQQLIAYLREHGVMAVFHYLPLHLSEYGRKWGGKVGDCLVAEQISDCLVRLPFYNIITEEDQSRVISLIRQFRS